MTHFTVGLIQDSASNDFEATLAKTKNSVRKAASLGAQIICLKELFCSPYFCTTESATFFDLAEDPNGRTVTSMQALAKELGVVIVVPYYEKRIAGVYHNSVAVIDADGSCLGQYRKMHIPDDPLFMEKYYFTPGDSTEDAGSGYKVFKTKFATIGVLICWDQWYPEASRITALMGADILFYPTAIGWHPAEKAEFGAAQVNAWRTIQTSHAIANGVFVASVNRVGFEETPGTDGLEFFGHSFIADPFGRLLADEQNTEEKILIASCDKSLIEYTRRNWPFLRDRRIDSYSPILKRVVD